MSTEKIKNVAQHSAVLQKSLDIYVERSMVRGELWAGSTPETMLYDASSKLARAKGALAVMRESIEIAPSAKAEYLDSLYDMINFAVFAVRHVTGEKPDVEPLDYVAPGESDPRD